MGLKAILSSIGFEVGNGQRIKFWKNIWLGALKVSYPSLFALAPSKEAWVREYWSSATSGSGWNTIFSRPFNDSEVEEAERLLCGLGR